MTRMAKRVLLIGWDAADWKMISPLLENGLMPNLQKLVETGVMGNLTSLEPILSPMLWNSIATGKLADQHDILGFTEPEPEGGGIRPVRSTSRKCKALWNIISEHGLNAGVVHWLATHPAECINGFVVSDMFKPGAFKNLKQPADLNGVWPPELAEELFDLLVRPGAITPRQLYPFVNIALPEVQKDDRTKQLAVLLAQSATTQAFVTYLIQVEEWDFIGVYFEAIDRFCHEFMEYHPPKMPHVSDEDFKNFQHVMNGCYRYHDIMLGKLMELAGEDSLIMIVSDHGFHSDHLRPEGTSRIKDGKPVAWHRPHGLLVASGAGIEADELVYGAGLLDIAPTILAALGIPVPEDMAGQVLSQLWPKNKLKWETIDTYENKDEPVKVIDGSQESEDPWVEAQAIQRLIDLGYIEDKSVEGVIQDRTRNLAVVYGSTNRPKKSLEQYEKLLEKNPDDPEIKLAMARCALQINDHKLCHKLTGEVLEKHPEGPRANLLRGRALMLDNDMDGALTYFKKAEKAEPRLPDLHINLGYVYLRQSAWEDAEGAFNRAIDIDPHAAAAYNGLGIALREQDKNEEAVQAHMQSVSMLHHQPEAHLNLGLALLKTGQIDWAIHAFEVTLELNPEEKRAHHFLAEIFHHALPDPDRAAYHAFHSRK